MPLAGHLDGVGRVAELRDELADFVQRERRAEGIFAQLALRFIGRTRTRLDDLLERFVAVRPQQIAAEQQAVGPQHTQAALQNGQGIGKVMQRAVARDAVKVGVGKQQVLSVRLRSWTRSITPAISMFRRAISNMLMDRSAAMIRPSKSWRHNSTGICAVPVPRSSRSPRPPAASKSAAKLRLASEWSSESYSIANCGVSITSVSRTRGNDMGLPLRV